jgi:hypothetical protein
MYGLAETTISTTPAVNQSVQPQFYLSTNKYGETFWGFLEGSSELGFAGFLYKYRVPIGVSIVALLGSALLLKKGSA